MRKLALAILILPLAACGSGEAPRKPLTAEQSAMLSPSDPKLAELYVGSCKACHTVKDSLAPVTFDFRPIDVCVILLADDHLHSYLLPSSRYRQHSTP